MSDHRRGFDPGQAVFAKRQRAEERGRGAHGMHRRTHVVHEAGQCERGRTAPTANGVLRLVHDDVQTRASELDRGRKTVRTGTYNNGVCCGHVFAITPVDPMLASAELAPYWYSRLFFE